MTATVVPGRLRVNVGCGRHHAPRPWINVDTWHGVRPDVVADARALPWRNDSADVVYLGHVLEHMDRESAVPAVVEALRIAPHVMIVGPDVDVADRMAADGVIPVDEAVGARNGACQWPGDEHRWACTGDLLLDVALEAVGRVTGGIVQPLPIEAVPPMFPVVSRIGWQAAVSIRRRP